MDEQGQQEFQETVEDPKERSLWELRQAYKAAVEQCGLMHVMHEMQSMVIEDIQANINIEMEKK